MEAKAMKNVAKCFVVFLCVVLFASLLFFAVKQSDAMSSAPKAPLYASHIPIARSIDPTAISVELPENHNADKVVLYFGDELGRFDAPIGVFEIMENTAVCQISGDVVCPENATKIWVYTLNDKGMSDTGCAVDLSYPTVPVLSDDEPEKKPPEASKYALFVIGAAILLSLLGYTWLGKKPVENAEKIKEEANK